MRSLRYAAALLAAGVLGWGPVGTAVAAPLPALPPAAPLPVQTTAPSKPNYTAPASATPSATATPKPSVTATARPTPRPDPEGDRWIQLAIIGGGGLLGAVVFFMIIGSLLRLKYRHQARRNPR